TDDADPKVLGPVLERLHLDTLSTPGFYTRELERLGAASVEFEELTSHLVTHYRNILAETERRWDELRSRISAEFAGPLKESLQRWIDGGEDGYISWGVFHVRT